MQFNLAGVSIVIENKLVIQLLALNNLLAHIFIDFCGNFVLCSQKKLNDVSADLDILAVAFNMCGV